MTYCQSKQDSIKISINDARVISEKLIELEYEKQITETLRGIILNDSVINSTLASSLYDTEIKLNKIENKVKKLKWYSILSSTGVVLLSFLLILK